MPSSTEQGKKKTSNVSSGNFNLDQLDNGAYKKAKGTSSFNSSKKERNDAQTCLMILSDTTEEIEVDPEIEPEEEPELYSEHHCSLNIFFLKKKPVQLIDFTRTINVNKNYFLFF